MIALFKEQQEVPVKSNDVIGNKITIEVATVRANIKTRTGDKSAFHRV
jgi:hypothetical protein